MIPRLLALPVAAAALCFAHDARAQSWTERTGIYFRAAGVFSVMDPAALTFSADSRSSARRVGMPLEFSGKQLGWRREAMGGASLGVAVDARWFYARIGADLFAAPEITMQTARFRADVLSLAWASFGPRYAWRQFAVFAGARLGAAVMALRSTNDPVEYTAITGTYSAEAGFQWAPLRWLRFDATIAQDFASVGVTSVSIAASFGWSRGH